MKRVSDWLKTWSIPQAIVAGVALVCVTALAITITVQDDWGKLFRWLADPATSGLLISVATLFGVLYHRALGLPPTLLVLALLGAGALTGCGASALQSQATASTIAMRVLAATDDVVEAQEDNEGAACSDLACVDALHERYVPIAAALDSMRAALLAWGSAIGVAVEADAGADVPTVVLDAARAALGLWGSVVAIAATLGMTLPSLPAPLLALLGVTS